MTFHRPGPKAIRFAVSGALAAALLAGCASAGKVPGSAASASQAQTALARGQVDRAITLAEAAVEASPRDAARRVVLAHAYMKAGRFESAATTFDDAMELGDNSSRNALALALSDVAAGRNAEAVAVLDDWRESIPASDLGLALALAGETGRGVAVLADALRNGENTPKLRQNLAYAYALDGRWREARTMIEQDVPAGQVDARISDWAMKAKPEDYQQRVAELLSVPVRADSGQPERLALANTPSAEQLAAEAVAKSPEPQPAVAAVEELSPAAEPAAPEVSVASYVPPTPAAEAAPAPVQGFASAFDQSGSAYTPVTQPVSASPARPVRAVAVRGHRTSVAAGGTHLVQLGSFSSAQGARRAWGIFTARNPELRNYRMTITPAVVHGKNFWRVAAAGLNPGSARGLCSTVKGRGGACFAYAATNPPATDVPARGKAGPQLARRR